MTPPPPDPTTESDRDLVTDVLLKCGGINEPTKYARKIYGGTADAILAALAQRGRLVMDDSEAEMQPALPMRVGGLPKDPPPRVPGEGA